MMTREPPPALHTRGNHLIAPNFIIVVQSIAAEYVLKMVVQRTEQAEQQFLIELRLRECGY